MTLYPINSFHYPGGIGSIHDRVSSIQVECWGDENIVQYYLFKATGAYLFEERS